MKTLARLWPLLILPSIAAAQSLPADYDQRGYCVALGARTGGRTAADLDSCLADEARARTALETRWDLASTAIRERCLLRNPRHSYDLLNICVETEMERAR
jgi:hypothetical protein